MEAKEAVRLVNELVSAEVQLMKEVANHGTPYKNTEHRERHAATELFIALTGNDPTDGELNDMVNV
jgi:hypothetical protein